APGGSGAFREMVKALLETRAPVVPEGVAEPRAGVGNAASATAAPGLGPAPSSEAPSLSEARRVVAPAVDPAALASAVAPSLPADHRKSLAVVFRALAQALEG
ncbi:MAG: hypothetical protein ACRD1Z_06065, partial [Vicinamibacteria bacterium]